MEIDLGLAMATALSSASGWYAGHYFERKKAMATFARIRQKVATSSVQSTSGMFKSAVAMFEKLKPDMTKEQLDTTVNEFVGLCNSNGLNLQSMTEDLAKKFGISTGIMNANSDSSPK